MEANPLIVVRLSVVAFITLLLAPVSWRGSCISDQNSVVSLSCVAWADVKPPAHAPLPGETIIVSDFSGSMNERVRFTRKIDHVRKGLGSLLEELGPEEKVGLRVFGQTPEECPEPKLLVPLGADNHTRIAAEMNSHEPGGGTPLGRALELALGDFSKAEGPKRIILLSDGLGTCEPFDFCSHVREKVAERGIEVRIDVVGIVLDPRAKKELQCLLLGGGTYIDIEEKDIENTEVWQSIGEVAHDVGRPALDWLLRLIASVLATIMLLGFTYCIAEILYRREVRQWRAGMLASLSFVVLEGVMLAAIWAPAFGRDAPRALPVLGAGFVVLALFAMCVINRRPSRSRTPEEVGR